jgi:hypothetical protein
LVIVELSYWSAQWLAWLAEGGGGELLLGILCGLLLTTQRNKKIQLQEAYDDFV